MTQNYKAVYFADFPASSPQQKSVTLAFGEKTQDIWGAVKGLSSVEIRKLLGTENYNELAEGAKACDLPVNTYCIRKLKETLCALRKSEGQLHLPGMEDIRRIFDPVSVTFKDGETEPFVRWYPYLEGYSPRFVEMIIERYAPDSRSILDPFAGTATTAFTASKLGKRSFFCEINPLLQFMSITKIAVRQMEDRQRVRVADELLNVIDLIKHVDSFEPDRSLNKAYQRTFGDSIFFDALVYDKVLRLRSLIDSVALENKIVADLITVGVLSTLVPASRMKRAGDLRYKTPVEAARESVNILDEIRSNIFRIAEDMQNDGDGLSTRPVLVCEDARSLDNIPSLGVDTVITSPPYVNGTNYFRNTKIELWFLRSLEDKNDLSRFRSRAITAGINDVTVKRIPSCLNREVQQVVEDLRKKSYDPRIPLMVAIYFSEVTDIFESILHHLLPGAKVVVDIGDSCYAGVHVPVDNLLTACLCDLRFKLVDNIALRQRRSRGGRLLKQALLVFEWPSQCRVFQVKEIISPWRIQWAKFKKELPHQKLPFSKRNWGHSLHSLCSFPGKLKPAIAHHLVKTFVPQYGRVLDPFAGVGTIPFEAALNGRFAYGFEISPAALAVARAKVQSMNNEHCNEVLHKLAMFLSTNSPSKKDVEDARTFGFNGKVAEYFHPNTLNEILLARRFFQVFPPEKPEENLVLACMLHILHGNRPYALSRRSHPITPYKPSGRFEYRSLVEHLRDKVDSCLRETLPANFLPGQIFLQDATAWWPREIDALDAIITSPPFFDSTRFYLANWLRLWFAGWSPQDFKARPLGFIEEQQKKSFDVYLPVLRQARERLKKDGVMVLHLGKSVKCNMASELRKIAKQWFRSASLLDENVTHCESHGIRDKGTVTSHQYLVLY
jgi:DNA modification methylase